MAQAVSADDQASGVHACSSALLQEHIPPGLISDRENLVCFTAYVSKFGRWNESDSDTGLDKAFGIPQWTVHAVRRSANGSTAMEGRERPRSWYTVPSLNEAGLAPKDENYRFSKRHRARHPNGYDRGHLAQKYLAERLSPEAGRFTHNVVNAVPQRGNFNRGPWLTLECFTGAWANQYEAVWVITGPVFLPGTARRWLRSDAARTKFPIAIPDALFKIVAKRENDTWDALAFLYLQEDAAYERGPWSPADYLVSVARIEQLTGYRFDAALKPANRPRTRAGRIWPTSKASFDPGCRKFAVEVP